MKYSVFINKLSEQASFSYSGRISLLNKSDRSYLSSVLMKDGLLVRCNYKNLKGRRALKELFFDLALGELDLDIVCEPEEINYSIDTFAVTVQDLDKELKLIFASYKKYKNFFPPLNIRLSISPSCLRQNVTISKKEFDLLSVLVDYNELQDVLSNIRMNEIEALICLCMLKEKGYIKALR